MSGSLPLLPQVLPGESAEAFLARLMPVLQSSFDALQAGNFGSGTGTFYDTHGRPILTGAGIYGYAADGSIPIYPDVVQIDTQHLVDAAVELAKVADDAISSAKIQNAAITSLKVADAAILTAAIGDLQVTTAKIDDLAVNNAKIANVSAGKLTADTVISNRIYLGASQIALDGPNAQITIADTQASPVTRVKIGKLGAGSSDYGVIIYDASGSVIVSNTGLGTAIVGTTNIVDLAVTDAKINTLTASKLTAGTIDASVITVTNLNASNISTGSMNASFLVAGSITATQIASATITGAKIAANTITAGNIVAGTITATEIASGTITGSKIAATTITASNIVSGTITGTQIAATTIAASNIVSGTITTTQIASNTIVAGNIAASTITGAKIASATITAGNIAAGTITATEIASATITGAKIAAATITASNIVSGTITTTQIASGTIVAGNIAAGTITATEIASGTILASNVAVGWGETAVSGLDFTPNSPSSNKVAWASGTIYYTNAAGAKTSQAITGTNATWSTGTLYVYYVLGGTTLSTTTTEATAISGTNILLATYTGGTGLVVYAPRLGGTRIEGGLIRANSIDVNALKAGTVYANTLYVGSTQFLLDGSGTNRHISISDTQGSPIERVKIGKLGSGSTDWGITLKDQDGNTVFDRTGYTGSGTRTKKTYGTSTTLTTHNTYYECARVSTLNVAGGDSAGTYGFFPGMVLLIAEVHALRYVPASGSTYLDVKFQSKGAGTPDANFADIETAHTTQNLLSTDQSGWMQSVYHYFYTTSGAYTEDIRVMCRTSNTSPGTAWVVNVNLVAGVWWGR